MGGEGRERRRTSAHGIKGEGGERKDERARECDVCEHVRKRLEKKKKKKKKKGCGGGSRH